MWSNDWTKQILLYVLICVKQSNVSIQMNKLSVTFGQLKWKLLYSEWIGTFYQSRVIYHQRVNYIQKQKFSLVTSYPRPIKGRIYQRKVIENQKPHRIYHWQVMFTNLPATSYLQSINGRIHQLL